MDRNQWIIFLFRKVSSWTIRSLKLNKTPAFRESTSVSMPEDFITFSRRATFSSLEYIKLLFWLNVTATYTAKASQKFFYRGLRYVLSVSSVRSQSKPTASDRRKGYKGLLARRLWYSSAACIITSYTTTLLVWQQVYFLKGEFSCFLQISVVLGTNSLLQANLKYLKPVQKINAQILIYHHTCVS